VHISCRKVFQKKIGEDEMQVPNDKKSELYDVLNKCVYTKRLDRYKEYKRTIKSISIPFYVYFIQNLDTCKEMWMHYYRSELPIRATHTNNHIESFNRKIKKRIKRNMHFTKALEELLLLIDEHYEDILIKLKYSIKINTTKYNEDWLNQIKTDFSKKCLELVQEENT
jgi:hypothetical protein